MSFCPICGAHHDPKMPCADRAGELLRDAGIERKPLAKKELQNTIKKANRSLVILFIVILLLFPLVIVLSRLNSSHIDDRESAISYIASGNEKPKDSDYDRAIAEYNEAIASGALSKEELAIPYYGRADAWWFKGAYDKAISDFNEAIKLEPQFATAYQTRGITRFNRGEFSSAAVDLAHSQQLKPDVYTAIWLYLARMHDNNDGKAELMLNTNS